VEKRSYLKSVFEKVPVYICKKEEVGLDGAFVI